MNLMQVSLFRYSFSTAPETSCSVSAVNIEPNFINTDALCPCSYENPLITATTRSVITDIFQLSQHLRQIDVKTPAQTLAMFLTLFCLHTPRFLRKKTQRDPMFTAIQVWTELDDVSESESFGSPSPYPPARNSLILSQMGTASA